MQKDNEENEENYFYTTVDPKIKIGPKFQAVIPDIMINK